MKANITEERQIIMRTDQLIICIQELIKENLFQTKLSHKSNFYLNRHLIVSFLFKYYKYEETYLQKKWNMEEKFTMSQIEDLVEE